MRQLTDLQKKVYDMLSEKINRDVPIIDMYTAAYGPANPEWTNRDIQQKLAPLIARINEKLTYLIILPGDLKQTYRLCSKPKDDKKD